MLDPTSPYTMARFRSWTALLVIFHVVAVTAIAARVYVRTRITRQFGNDDIMLITAVVFNIVAAGLFLEMQKEAVGVVRDSQESYAKFSLPTLLSLTFYVQAGVCAKLAIASWFLSVARSNPAHRAIIITPLTIYITSCIVLWAVGTFRCGVPVHPVRVLNETNCAIGPGFIHYSTLISSILNSVCDWIFAAIPFWMVLKSKSMDRSQRISACVLIVLAILGSMISIARLPFLNDDSQIGPKFLSNQGLLHVFVLSIVENAVAITTISLATLKPLIKVVRRRLAEYSLHSESNSNRPTLVSDAARRALEGGNGPEMAGRGQSYDLSTNKTSKSIHLDTVVLGGIGILGGLMTVNEVEVKDEENGANRYHVDAGNGLERTIAQATEIQVDDEDTPRVGATKHKTSFVHTI